MLRSRRDSCPYSPEPREIHVHILLLHALHNQTAIDGSFKAVMPDGLIGRALIPCLGRLEAREFRDHDAFDGVALQNLITAVVDEDLDLVTREGCPDLIP